MSKLLIILSLCFVFAAELEVDGDLKVTGNIEAGTIDSLQQVIAGLQAQIAAMQGGVTSKIFDLQVVDFPYTVINDTWGIYYYTIPINQITGENLNWYKIEILTFEASGDSYQCSINPNDGPSSSENEYQYGNYNYTTGNGGAWSLNGSPIVIYDDNPVIYVNTNGGLYNSMELKLLITAQFPPDSNAPTYQAPEPPQNSRTAQ